jgi:hypothetical protein
MKFSQLHNENNLLREQLSAMNVKLEEEQKMAEAKEV